MRAYVFDGGHEPHDGIVSDHEATADGDVLVSVEWSSINYKDWLVAQPDSRVRRVERLVLGVEAAGTVLASSADGYRPGEAVICYGGTIGGGRDGGVAERISVPSRYVTRLPDIPGFDTRRAMTYGLAGYTAMASVLALEDADASIDGEVLVTGATGSVGSLAVHILARRGHRPVASTGSMEHGAWLTRLGAIGVIGRDAIADRPDRVLASERWAGAVDCVGGDALAQILRSLRYGATVAASGLVGGADLTTTVYPFITRSVSLVGIDSVETTSAARDRVWSAIAAVADERDDLLIDRVLSLEQVGVGLAAIGAGSTRGRWLVRPR